uniref:Uncharacterized protein n=1 Tax=Anguilla anguilla TaxID=7936 RepID=A0A0E9TXJ9_ANGAN
MLPLTCLLNTVHQSSCVFCDEVAVHLTPVRSSVALSWSPISSGGW